MLKEQQFKILLACKNGTAKSQRDLADSTDISLGAVNSTVAELKQMGLIDDSLEILDAGIRALAPYKVKNAIIMAAGLSSRFAPISYEKPKGVLTVRGEVLVERQIRQLHEAGIEDITIVVGYKKEEFFYLESQFGVKIVVNDEFATRNNNSTIWVVRNELANTYICSSDNYFVENPFEEYVFRAYYSAVFAEGETDEYCLTFKGKDKLITKVTIGDADSWIMMGHVYWDAKYSKTFVRILEDIYDKPDTEPKLWEDIYIDHISELEMVVRQYPKNVIMEFDSVDELRDFDPNFMDNVDSKIMDNICKVLDCTRADIVNIVPIKQGLTNLSFSFFVGEKKYVYRHPGDGTENIIDRFGETQAQAAAKEIGIDNSFIFEDPEEGWKISHFIDTIEDFSYHNKQHVARAMEIGRKLHASGAKIDHIFDVHEDTLSQIELLDAKRRTSFKDFDELFEIADTLNKVMKAEGGEYVLCHNDFYEPNFLISEDEMILIDWEYAGMADYASDLAVFICCSDYTYDEAMEVLEEYFQRELTDDELFHCLSYLAIVSFHWFIWALYQDLCGRPVGELLYLYYKYTKLYGYKAKEMMERLGK